MYPWQKKLYEIVERETRFTHLALMENPYLKLYLWYRPSEGPRHGDLRSCMEQPGPEYKLAKARNLSPAFTREQTFEFIRATLWDLPVLPTMEGVKA